MLSGWIVVTALMMTFSHVGWTASATTYMAGLFEQNRYVAGNDLVLGDYGGTCSACAAAQEAMCFCNQGGQTAFLTTIKNSQLTSVGVNLPYAITECHTTSATIDCPLSFVLLNFTDVPKLMSTTNLFASLIEGVATASSIASTSSEGSLTYN
jgi:adenylate cyclase